jgi:hypothetical protein
MPVVRRRTAIALAVVLLVAGFGFALYAKFRPHGAFDDVKTRLGIDPGGPQEPRPDQPGQRP